MNYFCFVSAKIHTCKMSTQSTFIRLIVFYRYGLLYDCHSCKAHTGVQFVCYPYMYTTLYAYISRRHIVRKVNKN